MILKKPTTRITISAILFTLLFYQKSLGLNLVVFELFIFLLIFNDTKRSDRNHSFYWGVSLVTTTLLFTIFNHSVWSYIIHFLATFLFIGIINNPQIKSWFIQIGGAFAAAYTSVVFYFKGGDNTEDEKRSRKTKIIWSKWVMFIVPVIIIYLFIQFYGASNPVFQDAWEKVTNFIEDNILFIFENISYSVIITLLFGLFVSIYALYRVAYIAGRKKDEQSTDILQRVRFSKPYSRKRMALKYENQAAVFLFFTLNIILLMLNVLDIRNVWFGFQWQGQYLKEFVHNGTFYLIVSIIVSVILVLFYFRRNQNFYSKNKRLRILAILWLAQNLILIISVGLRNYYYIKYYSLAYGRIAVIFFLILAVVGIITVYFKVKQRKSVYYLLRTNTMAWMIVLTISAGFSWDKIIAKYNFKHANRSFVHLNFLSELSNTALPDLKQDYELIKDIDSDQIGNMLKVFKGSSFSSFRTLYMTPERYVQKIDYRIAVFKKNWNKKSWLEWNYAEHKAYNRLNE